MELIDKLRPLAERIPGLQEHVKTEEATKNAFIMPFIGALGYNVFDPTEVVPEFTADLGTKKGEKVDYAVMRDGQPIILIECKSCTARLGDAEHSQLHRYFGVVNARICILTNGIEYKFYSDIDKPNVMDSKPFLELNMLDLREHQVDGLKRLTREGFNLEEAVSAASKLKYNREIKRILAEQLQEPDEEFVRFFASKVYEGRLTAGAKERFTPIVRRAFQNFIKEQLTSKLKTAFHQDVDIDDTPDQVEDEDAAEQAEDEDKTPDIETTVEEMEGYYIVKAILRQVVDPSRIAMRDRKRYCGILLDDNNRKPITRLHFNRSQKYIGIFDAEKNETRLPIDGVDDIFTHADALQATVSFYDVAE